jgi:phage repressor protein C with HTH and peptisase S24 domain
MNWLQHVADLKSGKTVQFRPKGNSMQPKISSGNLVTVEPARHPLEKGDIVFCKVKGNFYVHLVEAVMPGFRYKICNNKNHTNGTIGQDQIFGKVTKVEN